MIVGLSALGLVAAAVALVGARPPPAAHPEVVMELVLASPPAPGERGPAPVPTSVAMSVQPRSASPLDAFRGLSTWVDIYDVEGPPARQVEIAADAGVQTIFVQSARFASPGAIQDRERFGALLEAAHDRGLRVVAWYLPDFADVERDLRRSQAAIAFTSARGDRADAFGLDIEHEAVVDVGERTNRLVALSGRLRRWAGPDYPLAAIVVPPLQLELREDWWPAFPYDRLREHFDVFVPMSYSSFRGGDAETTYRWNHGNVVRLRELAGDPDLPVHLAGGLADDLPELAAFVAAAADAGVIGAGLYDLATTPAPAWAELRALRASGR